MHMYVCTLKYTHIYLFWGFFADKTPPHANCFFMWLILINYFWQRITQVYRRLFLKIRVLSFFPRFLFMKLLLLQKQCLSIKTNVVLMFVGDNLRSALFCCFWCSISSFVLKTALMRFVRDCLIIVIQFWFVFFFFLQKRKFQEDDQDSV